MSTTVPTSQDLQALRAVHDALLDPLSHDTIEAWLLEVCAGFQTLCHAAAGFAGYSFPQGEAQFVSRELPENYLARMTKIARSERGQLGGGDVSVDRLMDGLRHRVSGVATTADLLKPGGFQVDELKETPMFGQVACPLGIPGSALLFHSGASGEYMLHAAFPDFQHKPFGEATAAVIGALLPAFAASVGALARLGNARRAIAAFLDVLEDGAVVYEGVGRKVLARNLAMCTLVSEESDGAGLERRIHQAARAAAWDAPASPEHSGTLSRGWRSGAGTSYRVRAIRLPPGTVTPDNAILVLVQRVGPVVPKAPELMRRFGMSAREAEVARLLAYGRSDREIAAELQLSKHTVRHHAEAVFVKVGITSRKALAVHLSSPAEEA
jgi:DNA-binding CsgD family transcriptional regulator